MTSTDIAAERENQIKELVADILELEPDEMTRTSRFKEDHEADSLLAIEILASLEKRFKITIAQQELARMVNLEGVYEVVAEAAAARQ
ncbi:acyl carrier protein [Streptomyces sp. HUAS 31]|uniref:Acyl carrier protein n=2 Tax=Streptomyces TaxID=1883 RepID=A0A7H8TMJ8_STRCX|nr:MULTISPECIES: acyl carrier protein [Streptomyces]MCZ4607618.1 acyl carrier protein [Streptomyces sp. Lzd4kr]QKZ24457.1 acyl carrier protein [Streptomyces chartreusis]WCD95001.1 acyl carrier protein [Streptomyces sp. HUAS 31]WSZ71535.1 acyl carrier protein [Streptomyces chartreusis]WTA25480.1 acyl carrier protein [Streptomyces chartreusis]